MGCVLRAWGSNFEPDLFLENSTLSPGKIWRKGELRTGRGVHVTSGFNVSVSVADMMEFDEQKHDAIIFLRANQGELARLVSFAGVDGVALDFGIAWKQDVVTQTDSLPPDLVRLVGEIGLHLDISHYPVGEE